jgi:hypothetical protein
MTAVACFITPHGFGHAARVCAVMSALIRRMPGLRFHLFTTVPRWFFAESLPGCFDYHSCVCDVGLVQISPLEEDLAATLEALDRAPWRDSQTIETLAARVRHLGCALVLADISPLGLRIARRAGRPSVLVENFTWDWIYQNIEAPTALAIHGDVLAADFAAADLRIQAGPVCRPVAGAVRVGPVARTPRRSRTEIRKLLEISEDDPLVLASMGGVAWDYGSLEGLADGDGPWVVVPGGADRERRRGRLVALPFHGSYFHPDLVHAADVVVGKLGYSTVAETCRAGAAMAYVERPRFPESPVLARFVDQYLTSRDLGQQAFAAGEWLPVVRDLLTAPRKAPPAADGADQAAAAILQRFSDVLE